MLSNDSDIDATDTLTVSKVGGLAGNVGGALAGSHGNLTLNADGSYSYTLDNASPAVQGLKEGEMQTDSFSYTIEDPGGLTDMGTLDIKITGKNDPPDAVADAFSTLSADIDAGTNNVGNVITNVLGMDSDPESDPLEVQGVVTGGGLDGSGLTFTGFAASFVNSVTVNPTPGAGIAYEATINTDNGDAVLTVEEDGDVFLDASGSMDAFDTLVVSRDIGFDYILTDGAATDTASVTLSIGPTIFFIDNTGGGMGGSGTQADPYKTIADFNAAVIAGGPDDPKEGDIVYLRTGSGSYNEPEGITLLDKMILIGQGQGLDDALSAIVGDTVDLFPPGEEIAGTAPTITTAGVSNNGIDLGSDNVVRGLDIGNTSGSGMFGASVGDLAVEDVAIGGTGQAIDFGAGGTLDVTFESIASSSSSGEGIDINGVGGSFAVTGATSITNSTGTGIDLTGSTADFTFGGNLDITTTAGAGLVANSAGTLHIDGAVNSIDATGGAGVDIVSSTLDGGATFTDVSSNGGTEGINLDGVTGSFTANGGSITGATGSAVDINAAGSDITYAGSITNTAGRSVEVTNSGGLTANSITLSGLIDDDGTGIFLDNNDQNSGATVNFTGGLDLDTGTNTAFSAINGGTVNVDDTGVFNDIDTSTGIGVNIADTTIGATGVTFDSVSVTGAINGIVLDSTGTGAFSVTGSGSTAGSGGTILFTVGSGVLLTSANNVSLSNLDITSTGFHGIQGTTVSNLDLTGVSITGAGNAVDENGIDLDNLLGTSAAGSDSVFDGITITGAAHNGIQVNNDTATNPGDPDAADRDLLTVTNGSFIQNSVVGGIQFVSEAGGTGNMRLDVSDSTFINNASVGIAANANGGDVDLNVTGSSLTPGVGAQFRGISGGAATTGDLTFDISDGNVIEQRGAAGTGPSAIAFVAFDNGSMNGTIGTSGLGGNTIFSSTPGSGSGGTAVSGISVINEGGGINAVTIENNDIDIVDGFGIIGNVQGSTGIGIFRLTVTDNLVTVAGPDVANTAMSFANSSTSVAGQTLGIDVSGNVLSTAPAGNVDIALFNEAGQTFQVQGLPGVVNQAADFLPNNQDVEILLTGQQTAVSVGTQINPFSPSSIFVPLPPLLAAAGQGPGGAAALSAAELLAVAEAAKARWEASGLTEAEAAVLDSATFAITNMSPGTLGSASPGVVWIDVDAAGWGWFVDATPLEDSEFDRANAPGELEATAGPAAGQVDLLTVVMHELGHLLGKEHEEGPDLMAEALELGMRRLPEAEAAHHAGLAEAVTDAGAGTQEALDPGSLLEDLQASLDRLLADVIIDYTDGTDGITLNLNGGAAVTLTVTEQVVDGVGTGAADTVVAIAGGAVIAILQDVNAAGGAIIDNSDVTVVP